jgi:putative transposase
MNDKQDRQHKKTADPVQTTGAGATGRSPLHNDPQRRRRSMRLQGYDYSQVAPYFVTVCAHNRGCVFGEIVNDASRMVHAAWEDLSRHYAGIELDAFVVMPDHVHVIIVIVGAGLKPAPTNANEPWRI